MRRHWTRGDWVLMLIGLSEMGAGVVVLALGDVTQGLLMFCLGFFVMSGPVGRRSAYNIGWVAGRVTMMNALAEAERRGHSLTEWMLGEIERDCDVFIVVEDRDD